MIMYTRVSNVFKEGNFTTFSVEFKKFPMRQIGEIAQG